ncbi:MAG: hypothetical protein U9P00_00145 [Pseudomonadota bacterium]|nr:hypothetical protein [Pseudomonadota bacterium]
MGDRARTVEEYTGLVDQVIFDLEDLRSSSEFDIEAIEVNTSFVDLLLEEVRILRKSMADGSYLFGREDLPFMRLVKKSNEKDLPFIKLFFQINQTHKQGLDIQED